MNGERILKIAGMNKDDKKSLQNIGGAGAVLGGGVLADKVYSRGYLTGKESLWHATDADNVKSIKEQGLKSSKAGAGTYTADVLSDIPESKLRNKVYMGRKRGIAYNVGLGRAMQGRGGGGMVKAKVPLGALKEVANPEWRGGRNAGEAADILMRRRNVGMGRGAVKNMMESLGPKGTATFAENVPSKYIVGGKGFKRTSMKEVGQFARKNKGKFGKGVAGLMAGGLLVGGGINSIRKGMSD